jgi:hypothetical protein
MDSLASVTDVIDNKKRPAARPASLLFGVLDSHPTVTLYHRLWGYGAASVTVVGLTVFRQMEGI